MTVTEQIIALAERHGLATPEDANLADLLAALDADSDIPVAAFAAMVEIVRYLTTAAGNEE